MSYNRTILRPDLPFGDHLIRAMAGLGMAFAVEPHRDANIEDTLLGASIAGMEDDDLRVLGLLVAWMDVHHARINVDRLTRAVPALTGERSRAFWLASAQRFISDRRWLRMSKSPMHAARVELLGAGNEFQIQRRGEDERFSRTRLRVPNGSLRRRPGDILSPHDLAKLHSAYRHRVLIGASYRADAWAALALNTGLTPSALARLTYASFATAWHVKQDFQTIAS
jgi:hypothetical protein